jgi:protein-tyrosine-phosphatase
MAEAFPKKPGGERFEVESAGLEPAPINPLAIEVMQEVGVGISGNRSQDVFELFKAGKKYDYVITVCDEASYLVHGEPDAAGAPPSRPRHGRIDEPMGKTERLFMPRH